MDTAIKQTSKILDGTRVVNKSKKEGMPNMQNTELIRIAHLCFCHAYISLICTDLLILMTGRVSPEKDSLCWFFFPPPTPFKCLSFLGN